MPKQLIKKCLKREENRKPFGKYELFKAATIQDLQSACREMFELGMRPREAKFRAIPRLAEALESRLCSRFSQIFGRELWDDAPKNPPPYGFDLIDGRLVKNALQQKSIEIIKELNAAGVTNSEILGDLMSRNCL